MAVSFLSLHASPVCSPSRRGITIPLCKLIHLESVLCSKILDRLSRLNQLEFLARAHDIRHNGHGSLIGSVVSPEIRLYGWSVRVPWRINAHGHIRLQAEAGLADAGIPLVELRDAEGGEGFGDGEAGVAGLHRVEFCAVGGSHRADTAGGDGAVLRAVAVVGPRFERTGVGCWEDGADCACCDECAEGE